MRIPAPAVNGDLHAWDDIEAAYRLMRAADRLAIIYPLLSNGPPADLRQLFDYVSRLRSRLDSTHPAAKAARVVVTTDLPAFLYRPRPNETDVRLTLAGIQAHAPTFIGSVESISGAQRLRWLAEMRSFGTKAA